MDYLKYQVDEAKMLEIKDFYHAESIVDAKQKYHLFIVHLANGVIIDGYSSKKGYTIVFSGVKNRIILEASLFFQQEANAVKSSSSVIKWDDVEPQIGSDEVGVGDFFLGFYVCATYLDKDDVSYIDSLGVMDSKKLTDSKIEKIAPLLEKKIKHFVVRISPNKLMEMHQKKLSTHMMLVYSHNYAHEQLIKKYHLNNKLTIYIDQFEKEKTYRKYAGEHIVLNPLVFQTKGESHYPSIATASVIARYKFLEDWQRMEKDLGVTVPKGAGVEVDKTYSQLLKRYNRDKLDKYVKRFFRNYRKGQD